MEGAVALMRDYFLPMPTRVLGDAAISQEERNAQTLARRIAQTHPAKPNISAVRDEAKLPGLRETTPVRQACRFLEDAGWLIAAPAVGPQGGRPHGDYQVHPGLWDALSTSAVE